MSNLVQPTNEELTKSLSCVYIERIVYGLGGQMYSKVETPLILIHTQAHLYTLTRGYFWSSFSGFLWIDVFLYIFCACWMYYGYWVDVWMVVVVCSLTLRQTKLGALNARQAMNLFQCQWIYNQIILLLSHMRIPYMLRIVHENHWYASYHISPSSTIFTTMQGIGKAISCHHVVYCITIAI